MQLIVIGSRKKCINLTNYLHKKHVWTDSMTNNWFRRLLETWQREIDYWSSFYILATFLLECLCFRLESRSQSGSDSPESAFLNDVIVLISIKSTCYLNYLFAFGLYVMTKLFSCLLFIVPLIKFFLYFSPIDEFLVLNKIFPYGFDDIKCRALSKLYSEEF